MVLADPEAFLRALLAPLSRARRGQPLPGVPFSREAVANAFVMLGLLPGARAEEILGQYRRELEAEGFRFGVLTGELSVLPGALGYHEARAAGRGDLTGLPLAVATGPVQVAFGGTELVVAGATLTPSGVKLRLRAAIPDHGQPLRQPVRELPGQRFGEEIRSTLQVTDSLGRRYRLGPINWGDSPGEPGQRRWRGEVLAEPQSGGTATGHSVRWVEFAVAESTPVRLNMPAPAPAETGPAEPPWPTPAEAYLAELASATSMTIATGEDSVELDVAKIVRAGLAVWMPLRRATAVIESIAAQGELVSIQLYGHPWASGEYWPMIVPSFQVRATDDAGAEHLGMPGDGGGRPEGSRAFWFWPPVPPSVKRIRVTVSTLWEAAWAELEIPGRSG